MEDPADADSRAQPNCSKGGAAFSGEVERELIVERYKFILQQIGTINSNIYRFLGLYQTLATALFGAELILTVNHRRWGISNSLSRVGIYGLMALLTVIAFFTVLLILAGVASWFDYRVEECSLSDRFMGKGFRSRPSIKYWYRWYENYIILFIVVATGLAWWLSLDILVPTL